MIAQTDTLVYRQAANRFPRDAFDLRIPKEVRLKAAQRDVACHPGFKHFSRRAIILAGSDLERLSGSSEVSERASVCVRF